MIRFWSCSRDLLWQKDIGTVQKYTVYMEPVPKNIAHGVWSSE